MGWDPREFHEGIEKSVCCVASTRVLFAQEGCRESLHQAPAAYLKKF